MGVSESFNDLASTAPRELWLMFLLKLFESYAYFCTALNMTMYMSDEFGLSDVDAGWLYGIFGVAITITGLLCGALIDRLGVRMSLLTGSVISLLGRLMFAMARTRVMLYISLVGLIPLGMALGIPVMTIAVKRYTNDRTRTFGFSLYYSVMNVAALFAGPVTDLFRHAFADGVAIMGEQYSPIRLVLLTGVVSTALITIVATFAFREVTITRDGALTPFEPPRESLWAHARQSVTQPRFLRLMLFTVLVIIVRLVYRHMDSTFPKYIVRELGEDAPYGSIYSINPLMVIVMVPIVGAYAGGFHVYSMIVVGSFISAASCFLLCIDASYTTAIGFVVVLSVGEVIYSPRVYEYTMLLAPRGREGLYTSLASAPMFVAKLFAGGLSGELLDRYCPKTGPRQSEVMWAIVGGISMVGPILMVALQPCIQPEGTSAPMRDLDEEEEAGSQAGSARKGDAEVVQAGEGEEESSALLRKQKEGEAAGTHVAPAEVPVMDLDDRLGERAASAVTSSVPSAEN